MNHSDTESRQLRFAILVALGGILACRLALYGFLTPPWQVPDEPTHFEYAYLLYRDGLFSTVQPDLDLQAAILQSMAEHRFWSYLPQRPPSELPQSFTAAPFLQGAATQILRSQPTYYLLGAMWLRVHRPTSLISALYLLRLFSSILVLVFFCLLVLVVRWSLPGAADLQLLSLSFVVFLPQLAAIGGGVNSDNLIVPAYSLAIVACLFLLRSRRTVLTAALLLSSISLCVLAKRTGLVAIPLSAWALVLDRKHKLGSFKRASILGATLAAALLFLQFLLTWIRPELAGKLVTSVAFAWSRMQQVNDFAAGESLSVFLQILWKSFWAHVGWLTISLPGWLYWIQMIPVALMLFGALPRLTSFDPGQERKHAQARVISVVSVSGILVLLAVLARNFGDFQPQGRYLFPALPALAVWLGLGVGKLPNSYRRVVVACLLLWFVLFDQLALVRYAIPAFYGRW